MLILEIILLSRSLLISILLLFQSSKSYFLNPPPAYLRILIFFVLGVFFEPLFLSPTLSVDFPPLRLFKNRLKASKTSLLTGRFASLTNILFNSSLIIESIVFICTLFKLCLSFNKYCINSGFK